MICACIRVEGAEENICSKMQDVTEGSRKTNSEDPHEVWEPNALGSQTKEGEMSRKRVTLWKESNAERNLVGKPKGKKPPERSRKRWNYNIQICV